MSEREDAPSAGAPVPTHGRVGPADPHADPPTDPVLRRPELASAEPPTAAIPVETGTVGRTRMSGLYVGLILSALVLILLLVFILQNLQSVEINFLGLSGQLPTGVALLLAAVAGVLLVAIPGTGRIVQLRRAARGPRGRGAR